MYIVTDNIKSIRMQNQNIMATITQKLVHFIFRMIRSLSIG